jgi:uncharacterized membrane protein YjgN (DUF898 family)
MVLRWWASGVRFGDITAVSHLRTAAVYGTYAAFGGLAIGLAIVGIGVIFAIVLGLALNFGLALEESSTAQVSLLVAMGCLYMVLMLGLSALYRGIVQLRLWRLSIDSLELSNTAALDRVMAQGGPSSPFGEGLADALDAGGL